VPGTEKWGPYFRAIIMLQSGAIRRCSKTQYYVTHDGSKKKIFGLRLALFVEKGEYLRKGCV